jgi:hypothetical protein
MNAKKSLVEILIRECKRNCVKVNFITLNTVIWKMNNKSLLILKKPSKN